PRLKVEAVMKAEIVTTVVDKLAVAGRTGNGEVGEGEIFVIGVEDGVRIRTGEHGAETVQHAERAMWGHERYEGKPRWFSLIARAAAPQALLPFRYTVRIVQVAFHERGPEALGHAYCGRDELGRSGKRMRGMRENPDGLLEPAPHLELEVARTHILRGAGSHESVAGVEALRVRIPIRHPQEHLDVVVRPRPVQNRLDEQVADATTPKPRVDPHRRHRRGADRVRVTTAHCSG